MSDTFITLVAIILAAVLVIVVPLVATSERVDTVSQSDVETLTSNFVDEIRTTGKLTLADYDKFLEGLTSTGNTYDVNLEFKILDENPGKKSLQTTKDKIGENVYYSIYTTQIVENYLENEQQKNTYNLKQGDIVSITVRNTNLTLSQQLKNFTYKVVGNDTYTISASKSGLVIGNGSTEVILASSVDENTIEYTLRENDSKGKKLQDADWTNKNVYVELCPTDKTYNFDLLYFWRYYEGGADYSNGYKNDGKNIIFKEKNTIQVYWKHPVLEKYSNIRTIDINIDRISPEIGSVVSTGNTGNVTVSGCNDDEGGSGLDSYYYTWINSKEDSIPSYPEESEKWNREISEKFNIVAKQENNGKYCVVWIKDKAGNVSAPVISDNPVKIAPKVTSFKLKNTIVKKGDKIKIQLENVVTEPDGNIIEYKNISYDIEGQYEYIATIDSNGEVTGLTPGKVQVNCYIENYDGTGIYGRGMVTVVDVSYSPNGGKYIMPTTGGATIKTTVTMSGGNKAEYAWSSSNLECTGDVQGGLDSSKTSEDVYLRNLTNTATCYLWTKVYDEYGNEVTYVSNPFVITTGKISIKPDKTANTNGNITCKITYPDGIIKDTKRVGYGLKLEDAKNAANNSNTETITVEANGYVYAEAKDITGNKITASLQISNIDKIKPTVTLSPNGGTYTMPTTGNATIKTVLTAADTGGSGLKTLQYAWSTSNTTVPTSWISFTNGSTVSKTNCTVGTYYLWTNVVDMAGNIATSVRTSNSFTVKTNTDTTSKIIITLSTTAKTNGNVTATVTYGSTLTSNKKAGYGTTLAVAQAVASTSTSTNLTVTANGYVFASATDSAGNTVTASLQITNIVAKVNITSFANTTLEQDKSADTTLNYTGTPKSKSFTSSNTSIVTVNSSTGKVTGKAAGTATITAKLTNYDGTTISKSSTVTVPVAQIGTKNYTTLAAAIKAVRANATSATTIKMCANTSENVTIPSTKRVILNLNGKKITGKTKDATTINNEGWLNITGDGTIQYNLAVTTSTSVIYNTGTLTLTSGTILSTNGSNWTIDNRGGTFTMNGGTVELKNAKGGNLGSAIVSSGKFTMKAGTVKTFNSNFIVITGGSYKVPDKYNSKVSDQR